MFAKQSRESETDTDEIVSFAIPNDLSLFSEPILHEDQIIARLAAISPHNGEYIKDIVHITRRRIEDVIALNAELESFSIEIIHNYDELDLLYTSSAMLAGISDIEQASSRIIENAIDVIKADYGSILLADEKKEELYFVYTYGKAHSSQRIKFGQGICGLVALEHNPILVESPDNLPFRGDEPLLFAPPLIACPMIVKEKLIGVIILTRKSTGNVFTAMDLKLLHAIASQAAVAFMNVQLFNNLEEAFTNLDEKNKELASFVYTVSHDLRAPLVSLEGYASMLLDNYKEALDETGQLYISRIQANVEKIGRLIQDLLELSRIGRIVNYYESTDVKEIIREAIETLQLQLSERGTELVVQEDLPAITCDRTRIEQVFENLISNANKFMGAENDKPRIEIGFHDKEDFFEFFVKDNGIGIQKEYHEKVFDIFKRLGDIETEGTGVGLAIVKKILENHGGEIWIDSEVGKGTTVYFTLPKSS